MILLWAGQTLLYRLFKFLLSYTEKRALKGSLFISGIRELERI